MITSIRGSIHQGHEALSEHSRGRQCAFMSLAALLSIDRIRSIYGHKQISMTSYVMEIAKYLVYFHVALDRQKKVSLIVLRIS